MQAAVWLLGGWIGSWRRARHSARDEQRQDFSTQTRGRGMRMSEFLRDRLRGKWLRLRR